MRANECNQCDGTDVNSIPVHSTDLPLPPDEPVHRPQGPHSLQLEGERNAVASCDEEHDGG